MNSLEAVLEKAGPSVAAVIAEEMTDDEIVEALDLADAGELRVDRFPRMEFDHLIEQRLRLGSLPLIGTIRMQAEGGEWRHSEDGRIALYQALLPYVDGLDVEASAAISKEVCEIAKAAGKIVILSHHNFSETDIKSLEQRFEDSQNLAGDYFKAATNVSDREDLANLARFTLRHAREGIITVGMGRFGPLSRIILPALGSHLIYASVGNIPVASGQLNIWETNELLGKLFPNYPTLLNKMAANRSVDNSD